MLGTRLVGGLSASVAFTWSARAARKQTVSEREAMVFRWFNEAPDRLEAPAWTVMQAGSLAAVFAAAEVTHRRRGPSGALTVLVVGTVVWAGIKLIKPAVGRGRPARHLDDVVVRGHPQNGLGFPSGHAAVSTALALIATRPGRRRVLALAAAAAVGCGRMYVGAHLPLDVGGGFAAGVLAGSVTNGLTSRRTDR